MTSCSPEALLEGGQDRQLDEGAAEAAVCEVLRDWGMDTCLSKTLRCLDLGSHGLDQKRA